MELSRLIFPQDNLPLNPNSLFFLKVGILRSFEPVPSPWQLIPSLILHIGYMPPLVPSWSCDSFQTLLKPLLLPAAVSLSTPMSKAHNDAVSHLQVHPWYLSLKIFAIFPVVSSPYIFWLSFQYYQLHSLSLLPFHFPPSLVILPQRDFQTTPFSNFMSLSQIFWEWFYKHWFITQVERDKSICRLFKMAA